ncbi:MAG: ComEC/Rec2 family competence protein, partial [Clostridia bacterium]|nr:ComEC/Rec2 family competence protein [Clostridia bacterium]
MDLLKNRPLAAVSLVLIASAAVLYAFSATVKLWILISLAAAFVTALVVAAGSERFKIKAIFSSLCILAVILAALSQLLLIDMKNERISSYAGDYTCRALIIEEEERSAGEKFSVKIKELDGKRVSFNGTLYLDAETTLKSGDMLYLRGAVMPGGDGYESETQKSADLDIFIYEGDECRVLSRGNFSLSIFFSKIRLGIARYFEESFGKDSGALARGVLLGDKGGIKADTVRDFRRAGVSHLLAVSGLHISMLMTVLELLLLTAHIGKKKRSIIISISALVFLGMTGFAPSACRSVLMILFLYLHYLFAKESDSLTALFTAVAVILVISPSSVSDVGLWLSFLATLGIISLYTPISRYLKKAHGCGARAMIKRCLRAIALALMLNFLCSIFTAFVVWLTFGEISLVSIIANPILTPLALVLLVSVLFAMVFAKVWGIGKIAVGLLNLFTEVTGRTAAYFSSFDGAVISLGYWFAGVIITLMSIALAVMLLIRLRRKQLIVLPPVLAVAVFAICLFIHNAGYAEKLPVSYTLRGDGEMIVLSDRYRAAVIDMSSGTYSSVRGAEKIAEERYATEISDYVITEYHGAHIGSLDTLFGQAYVRTLWLPNPQSQKEYAVAIEIKRVADEHGCDVRIYEKGVAEEMLFDTRVLVTGGEDTALFVEGKEESLVYIGAGVGESDAANELCRAADYLIFGAHGERVQKQVFFDLDGRILQSVFY